MCLESWKWLNFIKFNKNYRNKNFLNLSFQRLLIDENGSLVKFLFYLFDRDGFQLL